MLRRSWVVPLRALFSADPAGEGGRGVFLPHFFLLIKPCQVKRKVSVHSFQQILPCEEGMSVTVLYYLCLLRKRRDFGWSSIRVLFKQIRPGEEKRLDQNPLPRFLFSGSCNVNCNRISIAPMMAESGRDVEARSKETCIHVVTREVGTASVIRCFLL